MTILMALLAIFTLILIFSTALFTLAVLDRAREVIKTAALDWVQVYAAHHTARLDKESREEQLQLSVLVGTVKLEQQRDYGRLMIAQQRQKLIGTVPGGHNR